MKNFKKLLSCVVSFFLLLTALPAQAVVIPNPVDYKYEFSTLGKITAADFYEGSDTVVINIQDLHSHRTVQDNIYKFLTQLNNKNANTEIYLEGASSDINYSDFKKNVGEKNSDILFDAMYDKDKISGTEYFGYKTNKVIRPMENKSIYDQNIKNYAGLIKNKKEINNLLLPIFAKILKLKTNLSSSQRKLLTLYNNYLDKRVSSEKFYTEVFAKLDQNGISGLNYINSELFLRVLKENANTDGHLVESQLQALLSRLKDTISFKEYTEFLKASDNLTNADVIFAYIKSAVSPQEQTTKYPELFRLIAIRELSALINPVDLISEEYQMTEDILLSESKTVENKDIVFLNMFFQIYKKLLNAQISSSEYQYYTTYRQKFYNTYAKYFDLKDFDKLLTYTTTAENFNNLNIERNNIFVKNILAKNLSINKGIQTVSGKYFNINAVINSLNTVKNIKVVVSGGFHTNGINELLNKNKVSNITITPNVVKADPVYEKNYYNSIIAQAETSVNTINKMPVYEQTAPAEITEDISFGIRKLLEAGQSWQDITTFINGVLKEKNIENLVKFEVTSEEKNTAEFIVVNENSDVKYIIKYNNGNISLPQSDSTALGKGIKTLIKEALSSPFVRDIMGLNTETMSEHDTTLTLIQRGSLYLLNHNILLPDFTSRFLNILMSNLNSLSKKTLKKSLSYNILDKLLANDTGKNFENATVKVSDNLALMGRASDGYGHTEDYGMLFYVVWETTPQNTRQAKEILIAKQFLDYLDAITEEDKEDTIEEILLNLLNHERMEDMATHGESNIFNAFAAKESLPHNTDTFHKFIDSEEFKTFLTKDCKLPEYYQDGQKQLLAIMDTIVQDIAETQSEYYDILSLYSYQKNASKISEKDSKYDTETQRAFMQVRIGNSEGYLKDLAEKIADQIYDEALKNKGSIIDFINSYRVAYFTNTDETFNNFADMIADALCKKDNSISRDKIKINNIELNTDEKGNVKINETKDAPIVSSRIIFTGDIISKRSNRFNQAYKAFMNLNATSIQSAVLFDLSQEEDMEKALLTDNTYEYIKNNPDEFADQLIQALYSGKGISKYSTIWLSRLLNEDYAIFSDIMSKIEQKQADSKDILIRKILALIKKDTKVRGVAKSQIFDIALRIFLGSNKDINEIGIQQIDKFKNAYDSELKTDKIKNVLTENYSDWQDSAKQLLIFGYMYDVSLIDAMGINNIPETDKEFISDICKRVKISLIDTKNKLKNSYSSDALKIKEIDELNGDLKTAKADFEKNKNEEEYRAEIKRIMIKAKEIALKELKTKGIILDENLFIIAIGGSLVKGNITKDSDIFYNIIVPDGIITKSVEHQFVPLYSNILGQIGLKNYHISKYSTSNTSRSNINTVIDEKEVVPFLDYQALEDGKQEFIDKYSRQILDKEVKDGAKDIQYSIDVILAKYYLIAKEGAGWIGDSYNVAYTTLANNIDAVYSTRWSFKLFETQLNKIIFTYLASDKAQLGENEALPASVKDQMTFIKKHLSEIKEITDFENLDITKLENAFSAWQTLSEYRYKEGRNNVWTTDAESIKSVQKANKQILDFTESISNTKKLEEIAKTDRNEKYDDMTKLLMLVEEFVYDNSESIEEYRSSYDKYSHLDTWKQKSPKENQQMFDKAKIIALLINIDSPELRERLKNIAKKRGINESSETLDSIFKSIDAIKFIDENFPNYSNIEGERSIQNYWDAVIKRTANAETAFALIAHKLTNAQYAKGQEGDEAKLLVYSVYLPLSKRIGNANIYEYVRNDLFEYDHPAEYLNSLKIIELLYAQKYSDLDNIHKIISSRFKEILDDKCVNLEITNRVKTLYSVYEKLNSARKKDDSKKKVKFSKEEIDLVNHALGHNSGIFGTIVSPVLSNMSDNDIEKLKKELSGANKDKEFDKKNAEFINELIEIIKKSVFSNYDIIQYIENYKNEKEPRTDAFITWLQNFFKSELKDFVGLHIAIDNASYNTALQSTFDENTTEADPGYETLKKLFLELITLLDGQKGAIYFESYAKDKGNKQARHKINATVKKFTVGDAEQTNLDLKHFDEEIKDGRLLDIPIEICFYTETDHDAENYGIYDEKKTSSPHFIYKMGKETAPAYFGHIFGQELDYSFISSAAGAKKMVFYSDGFKPTSDFQQNFKTIKELSSIDEQMFCFVEQDGKTYIVALPKGSVAFDLASTPNNRDTRLAIYNNKGNKMYANFKLKDFETYTSVSAGIAKEMTLLIQEEDIKTKRGLLQYAKRTKKIDNDDMLKKLTAFTSNENFNNPVMLENFLNEILSNFGEEISSLTPETVSALAKDIKRKENLKYASKYSQQFITELLTICMDIKANVKFNNIALATFIARSKEIANHYNFANMFEFFEACAYDILDFNDFEKYYNAFALIKSKVPNASDIVYKAIDAKASEGGKIKKITPLKMSSWQWTHKDLATDKSDTEKDTDTAKKEEETPANYNLRVNDDLFFVDCDSSLSNEELILLIKEILDNTEYETADKSKSTTTDELKSKDTEKKNLQTSYLPNNKDSGINKDKETFYLTIDYKLPEKPLPLISLGNNVEQLVLHAAKYHSDMVLRILEMTGTANAEATNIVKSITEQNTEDTSALMAQVLLAMYSQDSYNDDKLLAQETPLLTSAEVDDMKDTVAQILTSENIETTKENVKIVASRTLDLIEDKDTFSLATFNVDENGAVTLYISESFLKTLETEEGQKRATILKQLAQHEALEFVATTKSGLTYEEFHQKIHDKQQELFDFASKVVFNVIGKKDALNNEMELLLKHDKTDALSDEQLNAIILCGSLSIESFEKAFKVFRKGKIEKIFITGNTRGSCRILDQIRDEKNQATAKYRSGIEKTSNSVVAITTVEEYLSLTDEALKEVQKLEKDLILVTEADIIKWILLKNAEYVGLSKEETKKLENALVLEKKASNTPENFENVMRMPEFADFISSSPKDVNIVIIQTPMSQIRAQSTFNRVLRDMRNSKEIPEDIKITSLRMDADRYTRDYYLKSVVGLTMSIGEWTRLIIYSLKGDIIPSIDGEMGINAIPEAILKNILNILPLLDDGDKATLFKLFTNVQQFQTKEGIIAELQKNVSVNSSRYILIKEFIDYMYATPTERKETEKRWTAKKAEEEKAILQELANTEESMQTQLQRIREMLSAA